MSRKLLNLALFLLMAGQLAAQNGMQQYKGNTYIFDANDKLTECNSIGGEIENPSIYYPSKGSLFVVDYPTPDGKNLVIHFTEFQPKGDSAHKAAAKRLQERVNYRRPLGAVGTAKNGEVDIRYFLLPVSDMTSLCSVYTPKWTISFGSVTTPFKWRMKPGQFTSNFSLGAEVYYQRTFGKDWSWGVVGGISLTSVTLDSFSTNGVVKTNTDRPAFTPSLQAVFGYKTINFLAGIGWDFINKTSTVEESWVYQGKLWVGFGIGVSLFTASSNSTKSNTNQATN